MLPRVLLCVGFLAALGCDQTTPTSSSDDGPDASPNPVDSMPDPGHVIGQEPPDSRGSSGAPSPATAGHGFVTLRTTPDGNMASAAFWNGADVDPGLDANGCRVGSPPSFPVGAMLLDAGDIDIFLSMTLARLEYDGPTNGYPPKSFDWPSGQGSPLVSAESPFGPAPAVPGFTALVKEVAAPKVLTNAADGGIAAGSDYAVAWETVSGSARTTVTLEGTQATVACVAPGIATTLTIPAALVKLVTDHPAALQSCPSCAKLTVEARSESTITAGAFAVALRHEHAAVEALAVH